MSNYFSKRLLKYESTANSSNLDYGTISQIITDKLVNINMGGSDYILEAVGVEAGYVPKVGDWVAVEWKNGNPIVKGNSTAMSSSGLVNINTPTIVSQSDVASGTINGDHIRVNSIDASHIQAGSITAQEIATGTLTSVQISANSITGDSIASSTITSNNIKAGSILGTDIASNTISAINISANAVTSYQISANAVQTQHISANSIVASQIGANQINATHISANSISASTIQANAVQTQHISANTIESSQIQSNAVQTQHISANTITAGMMQSNSVTTNAISANTINAGHLQVDSVVSSAISSNSIQSRHISTNSILSNMISANQINATHISSDSILSNMISSNQVQAQHISSNSIQAQHVSANNIMGYHISANQISGNHIVAGSINVDHLAVGTIQQGLLGQYYTYSAGATNKFLNFKGAQIDSTINFSWGSGSPSLVGQSDYFSVRWQGFVQAPETGQYTFVCINDDTFKVVVNNTQVINTGFVSGNEISGSAISLTAGNWYPILVEMTEGTGNATAILKWVRPSLIKEVIPQKYYTQGNTQIDGAQIMTGTITASSMKVGTITAESGILADASIQTANIGDGIITSAKIGHGEIQTVNIASGNITNALIANATIDYSKIASVDAGTITVGQLNGSIITAGTISGNQIAAQTITGDRLKTGTIDTQQLKAGSVVTDTIASGAITTDKIEAGAVTGDIIRAGSITAEHISTVGLDAQLVQVYNSKTGETLVGSGYLRVDGLDVGVIQSDNLVQNGLFLTSSSDYGFKRMNPSGEALLGNTITGVGSHQIWKINLASGNVVKTIDIPAKKPFDIAIHPTGNYAYITVQGDNTLAQLDLSQDILVSSGNLNMNVGPARIEYFGGMLGDMKHMFVLNNDPDDMHIPDSLMVVDTPPDSVNGDLYVHHEIVLGNNPYDFTMDSMMMTYVTMASQGDIVVIDNTSPNSFNWKIKGRIPISAYGTDNNHADLSSTIGLNEVVGGSASGQYNDNSMSGSMSGMGGMDTPSGYGSSDGSLRTYAPHGIVQSSDSDTLYVVDYANGELVVMDKHGNAPYNALKGTTASGSFQGSGDSASASPASLGMSESTGGGPGTYYVRYRFPVGDSPDFIQLVNGKLFISLEGAGKIAVIDESAIINEINADRNYYGNKNSDGSFSNWSFTQPMRTVNVPSVRYINNVGNEPSIMKVNMMDNYLYVSISGDGNIVKIDTSTETVVQTISVGTNPKGFDFTPDGQYMYVANYGGIGDLSFIYPQGTYVGDPYMALEGGIMYQGANGWTPDRSDWVYDSSGNVQSKSTVEFHINEPLKNEGGYTKLTAYGIDSQYAQIEQDIINVENYSNGNNVVNVSGGRLIGNGDNTVWTPREGSFISGSVANVMIGSVVSGNNVLTSANSYTVNYSLSQVQFPSGSVVSGNWVQADYTAPNDIYFKTHNASVEIAVDNGSSPNFATSFQVDEYVPNFVAVDNRQTSSFTPTSDGISNTYNGLEYSVMTNRALGIPSGNITSNCGISNSVIGRIVDGDLTSTNYAQGNSVSGGAYVELDLGSTYMIGQIKVWHYYSDLRTYHNTKTEVSEDGTNWTVVFDSAVSGEYAESSSGNTITFNTLPVRYVRDWTNGNTVNANNHWVEIQTFGDWEVEKGYVYPSNSTKAGQQIATNGIGFVSTDISKAYIAMNVQINFTSWWWMTYIIGPEFGKIKIEMPTLMKSSHYLNQQSPFVNNVAHRHIMSFPPSALIQADSMNNIEAGKHRVILRQESGKVTLDRIRFDDFQYYNRSTLSIPSQSSASTFTRYKVVAEQAKWYQGQGRQSTEGAYDAPRTNPDTGARDYSVPIKYRVRVLSQLSPTGNTQERGTIYATSAIFETGKQSTHWRRSESSDVFAGNKIETWNPSQPMNTGIQSAHLADGSVRSSKILPNAVYDYHISNYARIQEHKLELNYPTHNHANKSFLDSITSFAGISGNYGTGNSLARGDHWHPLASSGNDGFMSSGDYNHLQELIAVSSGNSNTSSTPTSGSSIAISSGWAYTHVNSFGIGSHIPSGGNNTTFLRGDGTWQTLSQNDTYVTSISGNGNGTFYLNQNNGQPQLTVDLSHTHSQYVLNNANNQSVNTGFTVNGSSYVGANNSSGALYIRTGSGAVGIQLAGDNSVKQSGVGAYIAANGTANFTGTITANAISISSTSLVNNLNAEMINSIKEAQLAKNLSVFEVAGGGVYGGAQAQAQSVPNMTVQITAGTVYTNTGMRIVIPSGTNVSFASPSTTYNRIDSVYVQGSSAGANEGVIAVAQGTPSASPVSPTIPSDGVLLANVTIRQNAGSVLSSDITDARVWRPFNVSGQDIYMGNTIYITGLIDNSGGPILFNKPIKNTPSNNSITIPAGSTSYTWTHNLNLPKYVVKLSCNNPEPHVYWSNKTSNAITINLDYFYDTDTIIDIGIEAY